MIFMLLLVFLFLLMFFKKNIFLSFMIFNNLNLSLDFFIDSMNIIFSLVVILISLTVFLYLKLYFSFHIKMKFKMNLIIFIFSMIILINSNNFISLLIGWDGLGISSFYLVSFYSNLNSSISSLITFFFNRLGDGFMMVFCSILIFFSSKIFLINFNMFLVVILFIGLITKSSQIPFGVWLPMAMSAPTPISSLVHSSTLVTAGIFVIMKMNFIFFHMEMQFFILNFSLLTFLLGGIFSLMILDMKKSVAFSTLSQLGFILFSLSLGNFMISFYHLIFHAFFKSSLFVNLGYFMILNLSLQDSRMMKTSFNNNLMKILFIFSCLNLMGLISTSGFISKDLILIFFFNFNLKVLMLAFLYMGCLFTAFYSMKFILFMFSMKLKTLKIFKNMKFNFFLFSFFMSMFIMFVFPIFFLNLIELEMENLIFLNHKILFYLIILFSIFLFKIILYNLSIFLFYFSSMVMILEMMNFLMMKKFNKLMNKFFDFFMIEEFSQLNFMMFIYKKNILSMMLLNLNIMFLIILLFMLI